MGEKEKEVTDEEVHQEDYEDKWSEKYLTMAAQVGAMQKDEKSDSASANQALDMMGNAPADQGMTPGNMCMMPMNPMMGMMGMNPMMGMMAARPMGMMPCGG